MKTSIDRGLFFTVLFLIGLGLIQIYSSSFIFAIEKYDDGLFFFKKQLFFAGVAISTLLATAFWPRRWMPHLLWIVFCLSVIGLIATLIPGVGMRVGGASRWIQLPFGFRFEPSEIFKMSFPFVAAHFVLFQEKAKSFKAILGYFFLISLPFPILLKQPDFGTFAIALMVFLSLLFVSGLKWRYVFSLSGSAIAAFYFLIINSEYRRARLVGFLDPWSDPEQKGFQIIQSLLSFYNGGLTGRGLGEGQGKLFFLPEAHTDFALAVFAEEMGFVGLFIVLCLFGFLIFRSLKIAVSHREAPYHLMLVGITLTLAASIFINASVTMGLLPTKGLAMPFLSYGGSSLVSTSFGLGLILNFSRTQISIMSHKNNTFKIHGLR